MICLIALVVFGIMGIFSVTYRRIAAEAFDCVFRKITLRKCESGLDTRLKSEIVGRLLKFSPKTGKFVFKHFQIISWIFTAIMIWSIIATAIGGYNFYMYGNCNGPVESGFCIFDPTGENSKVSPSDTGVCPATPADPKSLTIANTNLSLFTTFNPGRKNQVVFIGCYACAYTREAYPNMKKLIARDDVSFTFAHFPVKGNTDNLTEIGNCLAEKDPQLLLQFNDAIFNTDIAKVTDQDTLWAILQNLGQDKASMEQCLNNTATIQLKDTQLAEIEKTGIYGTPLVFINGEPVVGPKPLRVYERMLK